MRHPQLAGHGRGLWLGRLSLSVPFSAANAPSMTMSYVRARMAMRMTRPHGFLSRIRVHQVPEFCTAIHERTSPETSTMIVLTQKECINVPAGVQVCRYSAFKPGHQVAKGEAPEGMVPSQVRSFAPPSELTCRLSPSAGYKTALVVPGKHVCQHGVGRLRCYTIFEPSPFVGGSQ